MPNGLRAPTLTTPILNKLKDKLGDALSAHLFDIVDTRTMAPGVTGIERERLRGELERLASRTFKTTWDRELTSEQRTQLVNELLDETLGLGPLESLLKDPSISEIMINGPSLLYIERHGRLERASRSFRNRDHLMMVIERILSEVGRRVSESEPYVDARLGNGSRVTVAISPVAMEGPYVTIRKASRELLSLDQLIRVGSMSQDAAHLLQLCVRGRLNLVISGPASSGKTTLMNALAMTIPRDERVVIIEETAELQLADRHVVRLEARPPNVEGRGEVTIRHLLKTALHMRPDRILVGEVRGEEALDMLQAMNTGHDGSMTTLHANAPRDVLDRITTMALMSRVDLSPIAVERQVRSAIDLIVHVERFSDGTRKVTHISEVRKDGATMVLSDLFTLSPNGRETQGPLLATGVRPTFLDRLTRRGFEVPISLFASPP